MGDQHLVRHVKQAVLEEKHVLKHDKREVVQDLAGRGGSHTGTSQDRIASSATFALSKTLPKHQHHLPLFLPIRRRYLHGWLSLHRPSLTVEVERMNTYELKLIIIR